MATRATRAKPSVVPPPEDRSKNARSKKLQKSNKKTVTFEDEDEEEDSEEDEEPDIEQEESHVSSEKPLPRSLEPGSHGTSKDLPFQSVPALAYVPLGKNLRPT
jgi:hypothetical protein